MLPRKNRLPLKSEFADLKKHSFLASGIFFSLLIDRRIETGKPPQLAFIVSNKIDHRAVIRNKMKRWLSESVYPQLMDIKKGSRIVILAKRKIVEADFRQIQEEMKFVLDKAKLLKE